MAKYIDIVYTFSMPLNLNLRKALSVFLIFAFLTNAVGLLPLAHAQEFSINQLPVPGTMVGVSTPFAPLALKGIVVNPQTPLEFQFIVDTGKGQQDTAFIKEEANKLVKYFLAGLTIPEGDLWVNLSPYEKDRITTPSLGQTELGRDLLAQDYILKQLTASLIYPEKDPGKEFWSRVYKKAQEQFGTTNVTVNTFNKVWILPDQAQVFENGGAAYVTKSTLKVMLDEDYLAKQKHQAAQAANISSQIIRQIVIPEIEKEVNTGKNFAPLRQIYQALILAKWYKETIQNGLIDALYTDKKKIMGIDLTDPAVKEKIYARYVQAYKKGVFNYIKEQAILPNQVLPVKYFSGGTNMAMTVYRDGKPEMIIAEGTMLDVAVNLQTPHDVVTQNREFNKAMTSDLLKPLSQDMSVLEAVEEIGSRVYSDSTFLTSTLKVFWNGGLIYSKKFSQFSPADLERLILGQIGPNAINKPVKYLWEGSLNTFYLTDSEQELKKNAREEFKIDDIFNDSEFNEYWPVLLKLHRKYRAEEIFRYGFRIVKRLIKNAEDLDRIGQLLFGLVTTAAEEGMRFHTTGSNGFLVHALPAVEGLIHDEEDLKRIGQYLVGIQVGREDFRAIFKILFDLKGSITNEEHLKKIMDKIIALCIEIRERGDSDAFRKLSLSATIQHEDDLDRIRHDLFELKDEYLLAVYNVVKKKNPHVKQEEFSELLKDIFSEHRKMFSSSFSKGAAQIYVKTQYADEGHDRNHVPDNGPPQVRELQDEFTVFLKEYLGIEAGLVETKKEEWGTIPNTGFVVDEDHFWHYSYTYEYVVHSDDRIIRDLFQFCYYTDRRKLKKALLGQPVIFLEPIWTLKDSVNSGVRPLGKARSVDAVGNKEYGFIVLDRLGLPYPKGVAISEKLVKIIMGSKVNEADEIFDLIQKKLETIGMANARWELFAVRSNPKVPMPGVLETVAPVSYLREGLISAIKHVVASWDSKEAKAYRKRQGIPDAYDLPIIIQEWQSGYKEDGYDTKRIKDPYLPFYGAGVFSTRNPNTNKEGLYGQYLENAKGEELMTLRKKGLDINNLAKSAPKIYQQLLDAKEKLEKNEGPQEVEFVVHADILDFTQTRSINFSPQAEIAYIKEKKISESLAIPMIERLQKKLGSRKIYKVKQGVNTNVIADAEASTAGAMQGYLVWNMDKAYELMREDKPVIFVAHEANRDQVLDAMFDYPKSGLITAYGNSSAHEADLTRLAGIPSLINMHVEKWELTTDQQGILLKNGEKLSEGALVVIDGDNNRLLISNEDVLEENGTIMDASYGINIPDNRKEILAPYLNEDGTMKPGITIEQLKLLHQQADDEFKRLSQGTDAKAAFIANLRKHFLHGVLIQPKKADKAMKNGGIDLNQINVKRAHRTIEVNFNPAQLNELMQGGFEGFSPVIINITPIQSPLPLLGISPHRK